MRGPEILARTLSVATKRGRDKRGWQYHSRSDTHSKVACWTLLFDALLECDAMRRDADRGLLGFGINHVMVGPINKTLDLVLTRVPPSRTANKRKTFASLVDQFGIILSEPDRQALAGLPSIEQDLRDDVSEVAVAMEAKACMTKHAGSLPRLHAEILATGYLAKRAMPRCIVVSYSLINAADSFLAAGTGTKANRHDQPADARRVVDMLATAVPLARDVHNLLGYDVIGATVVECRNDGSVCAVHDGAGAPDRSNHIHYERMIRSLCSEYRSRYGA